MSARWTRCPRTLDRVYLDRGGATVGRVYKGLRFGRSVWLAKVASRPPSMHRTLKDAKAHVVEAWAQQHQPKGSDA